MVQNIMMVSSDEHDGEREDDNLCSVALFISSTYQGQITAIPTSYSSARMKRMEGSFFLLSACLCGMLLRVTVWFLNGLPFTASI